MILIACVDDRGGIAFNHRRQSSDSVVRNRILELTAGSRLWMNEYSAKQFDLDTTLSSLMKLSQATIVW